LLDTGGAIARARPLLGDEPFAIANCDALLDVDLPALWQLHRDRDALATLVVRRDANAERYGAIDLDAEGRVRRFLGQPRQVAGALERRMFCGVHVLSPEIFGLLPSGRDVFSITRDVYAAALAGGARLYGFDYCGYWRDVGTRDGLSAADSDLRDERFAPGFLTPA